MLKVTSLEACARTGLRIVIDDRDRWRLLRALLRAFRKRVLAYCIMDTHLHLIVEMEDEAALELLAKVMSAHAHYFLRRHGLAAPLLGGPVTGRAKRTEELLSKAIHYVHQNPVKAGMVKRAIEFPWSSARPHAGLSSALYPNVARARFLLGRRADRARPDVKGITTADLEPGKREFPPEQILLAAAAAYAIPPELLVRSSHSASATRARTLFAALGRLEGYKNRELASAIGLTRQRITQLARSPDRDDEAVRIARTLLREPTLRATLGRMPQVPAPRRRSRVAASAKVAQVGVAAG